MYPVFAPLNALITGQPAVASVGTTPAAVDVPASVPAPGLPATSNRENQIPATVVRAVDLSHWMS